MLIDRDQAPDQAATYAPDGGYVPRSMFLTSDGTLNPGLQSGRPDFRYFLNPDDPRQLLDLMAQATAKTR